MTKKILPVICPYLSYGSLKVQDGGGTMDVWAKMIAFAPNSDEREEISEELLKYCELDTFTMVEIYRFLKIWSGN